MQREYAIRQIAKREGYRLERGVKVRAAHSVRRVGARPNSATHHAHRTGAEAMGYNARNDEIYDNIVRMQREREAQRDALATVRRFNGRPPQGDVELMTEKQILGFEPASRLENVGDENCERI